MKAATKRSRSPSKNHLVYIHNKMPRAPKKSKSKAGKKQQKKKRSSSGNLKDFAQLSCKRTIVAPPSGGTFQPNTMYNLITTQLIDYQRAVQVAQAYQHYRITKVALTFKPLYDTFVGQTAAMTKPNLYYMLDKSGSIPTNINLEGLKQMGARPIQLDEKNLTRSWKPTVLESSMVVGGPGPAGTSPSKYVTSPWLSCNANVTSPGVFVASGVDHLGIYWWVDQTISTGYAYTCEVEVQFQFKKPLNTNNLSTVEALPAQLAVLNDSPDGIVGGSDGI